MGMGEETTKWISEQRKCAIKGKREKKTAAEWEGEEKKTRTQTYTTRSAVRQIQMD